MNPAIESLRWQKFKALSSGFVCLVDAMGDDASVVQAARVSYGKDKRELSAGIEQDDVGLIRYLMNHRHTTPFEMAEVKLLVRCPMDLWRQWIRHRTASVNEVSTRYTEAIDDADTTPPDKWRLQSKSNKQGSSGECVTEFPEDFPDALTGEKTPGGYLTKREALFQAEARGLYEERLEFGVAKEQARKDLPLSTYTEAYWKIDLHNLLHFLQLRMDSHAQLEIRTYANIIGNEIVAKLFPVTWQAFLDYRLNAMTLSAMEQQLLAACIHRIDCRRQATEGWLKEASTKVGMTSRELAEFKAKLTRLGCE